MKDTKKVENPKTAFGLVRIKLKSRPLSKGS